MSDFDRNASLPWGSGVARAGTVEYDQGLRSYMLGIYNLMTLALGVTALVAMSIFMMGKTSPVVQALYMSPLKWVVMLAPLGFIFFLSFRFERMSYTALLGTFLAFAATMGLSMGSIGFVFKATSIVQALFATTAAFGALSLYGYTTKRSLSGMGSFLVMGLFGLMIASLINLFVGSGVFSFVISLIGVVIFAGLTAWDTQRLKEEYDLVAGTEMAGKASIMGALTLYLNFINLVQLLLSLIGQREDYERNRKMRKAPQLRGLFAFLHLIFKRARGAHSFPERQ
jgi:FtsH-binding integral membrane protein